MNETIIKKNFQRGLWTVAMVQMAVNKGLITQAQYQQIVAGGAGSNKE